MKSSRTSPSLFLGLVFLLGLVACRAQNLENSFVPEEAEFAPLSEAKDLEDSEGIVEVAVNAGRGLGLTSTAENVIFSLHNCVSGNSNTISDSDGSYLLQLYKFDQNCKVSLDQFEWEGEVYTVAGGETFSFEEDSYTTFSTGTGKDIEVLVVEQLPDLLVSGTYSVSFAFVTIDKAADTNLVLSEVGVHIVDVAKVNVDENTGGTIDFYVQRATPATGVLEVKLKITGDADSGTDYSAFASSIIMADGQDKYYFSTLILDDGISESMESFVVEVDDGSYMPTDHKVTVNIFDDDTNVPATGQIFHGSESGMVLSGSQVQTWTDLSGAGHNAYQNTSAQRPLFEANYFGTKDAMYFDGTNDYFIIANNSDFNSSGPYSDKTIAIFFETSGDVSRRQIVYEQGNKNRGLNIYLDGGKVYFCVWNVANDGDPTVPYGPKCV